jgi:hypothetical protein
MAAKEFLENGTAEPNYLQYFHKYEELIRRVLKLLETKESQVIDEEAPPSPQASILGPATKRKVPTTPRVPEQIRQRRGKRPLSPKKMSNAKKKRAPQSPQVTLPTKDGIGRPRKVIRDVLHSEAIEIPHKPPKSQVQPRPRREVMPEDVRIASCNPVKLAKLIEPAETDKDRPSPLIQRPAPAREEHPKYAGKQISEQWCQDYYRSMKEQKMLGFETVEEAEGAAARRGCEPSPITEQDEFHYVYSVKRKQWAIGDYESNADWFLVQDPTYYSVEAANSAANRETMKVRGGLALDRSYEEQCLFKNDEDMVEWFIRIPQGFIHIKVERTLRYKGHGKLPGSKAGWLSEKVWIVKKKTYARCRRSPPPVPSVVLTTANKEDGTESFFKEVVADVGDRSKDTETSDDDDKYDLVFESEDVHDGGAWTVLDQANRVAGRWMLDALSSSQSMRIDVVNKRHQDSRAIDKWCDQARDEKWLLNMDEVTMDKKKRVFIWVEEMKLNGPWN